MVTLFDIFMENYNCQLFSTFDFNFIGIIIIMFGFNFQNQVFVAESLANENNEIENKM